MTLLEPAAPGSRSTSDSTAGRHPHRPAVEHHAHHELEENNPMSKTTTGPVWLDTRTGKIANTEPEEGRLLVSAGDEITDTVRAQLDLAIENHAGRYGDPDAMTDPTLEPGTGDTAGVDVGSLNKAQLVELANERGVDSSGTVAELRDRLA